MPKWFKTILILGAIAWLLRFPPTRAVILFLLPIGSGVDDVIVIAAVIVAVLILVIKKTRYGRSGASLRAKVNKFFEGEVSEDEVEVE